MNSNHYKSRNQESNYKSRTKHKSDGTKHKSDGTKHKSGGTKSGSTKHKSSRTDKKSDHTKHCQCRGPEGPVGPIGPPGPTGPPAPSVPSKEFIPTIINKQNKIIDPLDITDPKEEVVVTISVDIPVQWNTYDIVLEGELYADDINNNCCAVMSLYKGDNNVDSEFIGSQVIGYNGMNNDGIGFTGYHKEILNDQTDTGNLTFCMTVKSVDTIIDKLCSISVINRYIYLQAVRQSYPGLG